MSAQINLFCLNYFGGCRCRISIHSPKGATSSHAVQKCVGVFQPTLPMKGATYTWASPASTHPVSIHAPNEGSDSTQLFYRLTPFTFQSTLPMKGATLLSRRRSSVFGVSIHAPNEGSDKQCRHVTESLLFQSTLPMKGATFLFTRLN